MPPSRREMLRSFIDQRPEDPFPRYALALDYKTAGELDEAWRQFETLMQAHAAYAPAYLHAGNTLIGLGRMAEAKSVFEQGVEICAKVGDAHARGELEQALSGLG